MSRSFDSDSIDDNNILYNRQYHLPAYFNTDAYFVSEILLFCDKWLNLVKSSIYKCLVTYSVYYF